MKDYTNVSLVSPKNLRYRSFCRKYTIFKSQYKKDYFEQQYQIKLMKWEYIIQFLLSKLIFEEKNRILKYTEDNIGRYREIDFIGKPKEEEFMLCEIKLKQEYAEKMSSKKSGWSQINKQISILSNKYENIGGLSICMDMSYLYNRKLSVNNDINYCKYKDLYKYLIFNPSEKNTIWLNSLEISKIAINYGLITRKNVLNMEKSFNEKNNPLSILGKNRQNRIKNNPFEELKKLYA